GQDGRASTPARSPTSSNAPAPTSTYGPAACAPPGSSTNSTQESPHRNFFESPGSRISRRSTRSPNSPPQRGTRSPSPERLKHTSSGILQCDGECGAIFDQETADSFLNGPRTESLWTSPNTESTTNS